jgi:hypothetical protein
LRTYVESQFRARSLSLNVKYEVDVIALIARCVVAGLGASLLPGLLSRKNCARFNRNDWLSVRKQALVLISAARDAE